MSGPQPGTPTPWQREGSHIYGPSPEQRLVGQILTADGRLLPDANAIVHRVNNWDAVVEALEAAEKHFGPFADITINDQYDAEDVRVTALMRAALAKARGEA